MFYLCSKQKNSVNDFMYSHWHETVVVIRLDSLYLIDYKPYIFIFKLKSFIPSSEHADSKVRYFTIPLYYIPYLASYYPPFMVTLTSLNNSNRFYSCNLHLFTPPHDKIITLLNHLNNLAPAHYSPNYNLLLLSAFQFPSFKCIL